MTATRTHNQRKTRTRNRPWIAAILSTLTSALPTVHLADVIYLKNGNQVTADRAWIEGETIRYERAGNIFGFSKSLVSRIETRANSSWEGSISSSTEKVLPVEILEQTLDISEKGDADVVLSDGSVNLKRIQQLGDEYRRHPRDAERKEHFTSVLRQAIVWLVNHNDFGAALSLTQPYIQIDPDNLQANLTLAWLHLKQGSYRDAQEILLQARIKNSQSPDLAYSLGMAYYLQDKNDEAVKELRRSLQLREQPEVERLVKKIEQENRAEDRYKQANSLHFVIRYEGSSTNRILGKSMLTSLEQSFLELESALSYAPKESIAVVLYPDEVFQDITKSPAWVGALNDGKLRIPIKGLSIVDANVRRVLKHELTHSFLRLKAAGNCPVWFNEGLAQLLSEESAYSIFAVAKKAVSEKRLPQLRSLEGSILNLNQNEAGWVYQVSLLAAEFLEKTYGWTEIQKLLEQTAKVPSFGAALKATLRIDYPELQRAFELYIVNH